MRGDLYTGLVTLAGQFPPSVNTSDDVTALKPFESPACYGVDITRDGQLKTGTIPTGTSRVATTKTIGSTTYYWHYDRIWRSSGANLIYGAQFYDEKYVPQGRGKVLAEQTIVGFQPAFKSQMWTYGASGSQMLSGRALSDDLKGSFDQLIQEMTVSTGKATSAVTLDEIPYCANTKGVWSYDGKAVTEITRPVRNSLGVFASEPALTCNYYHKYLIGGTSFAIDVTNGKLFDYTAGFLFTSRTLVGKSFRPFGIGDLSFSIQFAPSDPSDGTITWQSKAEDNDWFDEEDINVVCEDGLKTVIQVRPENPVTTARKFAIRLTGLSDNVYIRSIDINVSEYDQGTISV
jgi:hypothetical protein